MGAPDTIIFRMLNEQEGRDTLISRSQAKQILSRANHFKYIVLDFDGVLTIGQAFADETFRVFASNNPDIVITPTRTNQDIENMIARARRETEK